MQLPLHPLSIPGYTTELDHDKVFFKGYMKVFCKDLPLSLLSSL